MEEHIACPQCGRLIHVQEEYDVASVPGHEEVLVRIMRAGLSKAQTFFFTFDSGMKNAARRDQRHQGYSR